MPLPVLSYGDTVNWTGTNPDAMVGTGFGPVPYIVNPGTVTLTTPYIAVVYTNDAMMIFAPGSSETAFLTVIPTPP